MTAICIHADLLEVTLLLVLTLTYHLIKMTVYQLLRIILQKNQFNLLSENKLIICASVHLHCLKFLVKMNLIICASVHLHCLKFLVKITL